MLVCTFICPACVYLGVDSWYTIVACISLHPRPPASLAADGADEALHRFASGVKDSCLKRLEITSCTKITPYHIATLCGSLHESTLEDLTVISEEVLVVFFFGIAFFVFTFIELYYITSVNSHY